MKSGPRTPVWQRVLWVVAVCWGAPTAWASGTDPLADFLRGQGWLSTPEATQPSGQATESPALSGLVVHAMAYLDTPYRLGGNSMDAGLDCSGFVQTAVRHTLGVQLPRRASEQAQATRGIDMQDAAPGDLVFFNTQGAVFSHVGIYVGEGRFIHAPRAGAHIRLEHMDAAYWQARFNGARRVDGPLAQATTHSVH